MLFFYFVMFWFFFFKQKTAYEMRISDWSSDVCSSDLDGQPPAGPDVGGVLVGDAGVAAVGRTRVDGTRQRDAGEPAPAHRAGDGADHLARDGDAGEADDLPRLGRLDGAVRRAVDRKSVV